MKIKTGGAVERIFVKRIFRRNGLSCLVINRLKCSRADIRQECEPSWRVWNMILHFNLKDMFFLCIALMCWHTVLPWTAGLAAVYFGGTLAYLHSQKERIGADAVLAAAFLLNLWYVLESWGNVRQYDYYNFLMHADYFLQNGFFAAAPSAYLQSIFFQPPLWGLISAVAAKLGTAFGVSFEVGFDGVRFISLFCVTGAAIIFWRLATALQIDERVKPWLWGAFCFFPAHGIAANLVNNDAAVYFLMTAMMYAGYQWHMHGRWTEALILSVLLLAAGLVKFSGLMMVPALGMLGIFRLLREKNKLALRMWGQFAVIGLGAVVGFAWGWFLLAYDFPLVPPPVGNAFQDLSRYSLAERLFGLAAAGNVFADVRAGLAEPNVWLALVKTSLFGEWSWQGAAWAYILYGLGCLLAIVLVLSFFSMLCYKMGEDWGFNAFMIVLAFSVLAAWFNFWMAYPYFCSSEYRYVMILLPASFLWFGNYLTQKSLPRAVYGVLAGGVVLLIMARFMLCLNTI